MSAYTDHLADPLRRSTWLVEISTTLLADGSAVTLRYASDRFITRPTDSPASALYEARLIEPLSISLDAGDVDATGGLAPLRVGAIRLGNRAGDLDSLADTYALQGSEVRVLLGGYTPSTSHEMTYAEYGEVGVVEVESVELQPDELVLGVRDLSYRLDDRLESRYYGGRDYCARFDNGGSHFTRVTYGAPAKLDLTGSFTAEAWVYLETASGVGVQYLVGWALGATTYPWEISIGNTGVLRYSDTANGTTFFDVGLSTHRWYHLAVTRSGTALQLIYWDSETGVESVVDRTLSGSASAQVGATFAVGNNWRGLIGEVRVYDTALSAYEIRNRRWEPLTLPGDPLAGDLVFYATLNESTTDLSSTPATATTVGTASYLPTLDGEEDIAGSPLPVVYGGAENVTPPLVDPRKLIYQIADADAVASVDVFEGGLAITAGTARKTLIALLATAPTAGTYDWHLSPQGGYVRLGSLPTLPITATIECKASALSEVLEDVLTERGRVPFEVADLDLSLAIDPDVQFWATGPMSVRDCLDYLLSGIGAYWVTRGGSVKVRDLPDPGVETPVATLTEAHVISWQEVKRLEPVWIYRALYRRNWTVLENEALAGALIGTTGETFFRREWRYARASSVIVRESYPRAKPTDRETAIAARADALELSRARLVLFNSPGRLVRVDAVLSAAVLDRYDVITLDIEMPSTEYDASAHLYARKARTGLAGEWAVLGIAEDQRSARQSLTLWRPQT